MPKVIHVQGIEDQWDPVKEEFLPTVKPTQFTIEHSLVSISLWESKWHKPYMGYEAKTDEELMDYIKCMTLEDDIDDSVYARLTQENIKEISEYIQDPMTATTINDRETGKGKEIVTSEILYYQMIALRIPVEFENWHLNRLITLIKVCAIKSDPKPKKMPKAEMARKRAALNAKRRAAMHSKG